MPYDLFWFLETVYIFSKNTEKCVGVRNLVVKYQYFVEFSSGSFYYVNKNVFTFVCSV